MTFDMPHTLGSYDPQDVTFLLKEVRLEATDITEKERKIQSGEAHYSEMISDERRPDERYLDLFKEARVSGDQRIAEDIVRLGQMICDQVNEGLLDTSIVLCSLVRAGLPYGVMLVRELRSRGIDAHHYGVSIIRDKGLDVNAMNHIIQEHGANGVVFVDGWTGKGAISNQLSKSWNEITGKDPVLAVVADPSGYATLSGSHEDWLIPSGILGANISGLISRTILNKDLIGPDDFHGTMSVEHLSDIDISTEFVDTITEIADRIRADVLPHNTDSAHLADLRATAQACVQKISHLYDVDNLNRIKPGIAEATRAVLRRRPEKVFVRQIEGDKDLKALLHLCATDNIDVVEDPELTGPYRAITLIGKAI